MSLWRLEGAALDPATLVPGGDVETDESGRIVVTGELEPLLEIIRIPGFQLHLLRRDPQADRPVVNPPVVVHPAVARAAVVHPAVIHPAAVHPAVARAAVVRPALPRG